MSYPRKVYCVDSDNVGGASEEILYYLGSTRGRVSYFHGWTGFGTEAVLRSIVKVIPSRRSTPEEYFDRIIYIDCSEWKSRRSMQRAIAEELKLARSVMAILDKQDEEDDFCGMDQGSRDVIESVAGVIDNTLRNIKFMMIFLNGTDEEIDVTSFGIPQFLKYRDNVMIWTFKRRFFLTLNPFSHSMLAEKIRYTDSIYYNCHQITELSCSQFEAILVEEANIIVARNPCLLDIDPATVVDCWLYKLFLNYYFHTTTKFDWVVHASSYWICDGIVQGDITRDISNTLHREINWECNASMLHDVLKKFMKHLKPPFLVIKDGDVYEEGHTVGFQSYQGIQKYMCHTLRFLGLDCCIDDKTGRGEDHIDWTCLYSLWVLELRYTDWNEILSKNQMDLMANVRELNTEGLKDWHYIAHLQGRLPNLQRLRTIKPACQWETPKDVDSSFTDKTRMEILDLSGNSDMEILPRSLSKASNLQMLVLDGCAGLGNIVAPDMLPSSLRSFSFDGYGSASQWAETVELPPQKFRPSTAVDNKDIRISKISLEGCTQLENLFLRGLPNLVELDLSGTAIKILDFKTMVVQVPNLKRLFLIGCKNLRAINPLGSSDSVVRPDLELLCIDTRDGIGCHRPFIDKNKSFRLQVYAVIVDARLTQSIDHFINPYLCTFENIYVNICITSSPVYDGVVQLEATHKDEIGPSNQMNPQEFVPVGRYFDVLSMLGDAPMEDFSQHPTTKLDRHIEIGEGSRCGESQLRKLSNLLDWCIESIHVHDASLSAMMPEGCMFRFLKRCCVDRCPKLDTVFPMSYEFSQLETFWASDLQMARSICHKVIYLSLSLSDRSSSFINLKLLQLRSCPRLQFVLPEGVSFPSLETLHILHCGSLEHVFILYELHREEITVHGLPFPKLTTIHLHDLPKLRKICDVKMVAPALQTIKIRGCWVLCRLPVVAARGRDEKKPTVEIEKDVWDALEWDGTEAGHHPDHFEAPIHSRYYKKKLPRVSFLR